MASIPGPTRPDLRKNLNASQNRYPPTNPPRPPNRSEQFYGHEEIARLSARFITHLFACPEMPPASTNSQSKLPNFVAYALHRTKLHESVTFAALILLQRLKARFPTARGSSGHRLFISAFMIASKVICDDTYSNKSWSIVAQGMFSLREINQMEREMCSYLDWELSVDDKILSTFEQRLREDFKSTDGPYPTFPLSLVSKRAAKAASSTTTTPVPEGDTAAGAIPPLGQQRHESPAKKHATASPDSPTTWASPPDTPSPSYSNSTSPASSGSPATPIGGDDYNPKVRGFDSPPVFAMTKDMPPVHPLKGQMFAMAMPSTW